MCPRETASSHVQEAGMPAAAAAGGGGLSAAPGAERSTENPSPEEQRRGTAAQCDERWVQVRDKLIDLARKGNADVARYGDMITSELACTRFLRGGKGKVDKAVEMFEAHLAWRVKYKVETIVDENFADLKAHNELYWGGRDREGVMTLVWNLHKHDSKRTEAKRFVRFFIHQIESGLRTCPDYPNGQFNIAVDLDKVGYANSDQEMSIILQSVLAKNYPKVRKGLFVFPVNWFVQLFWDTLLKPLLSTLQPDIEDKICPLTGDWKAKLRERYEVDQIETRFGGELDLSTRPVLPVLPYTPVPYAQILGDTEAQSAATKDATEHVVSGAQGDQGAGAAHREATPDSDQAHARCAAVGEGALREGALGVSDGTVGMAGNQLELVTSRRSPELRSKSQAAAIKCLPSSPLNPTAESCSLGVEGEDEFLTPDASPRQSEHMSPASMRSAGSGPSGQGGELFERLLEADEARNEESSERTRAAIVVGTSGAMAGSNAGIARMRRSESELELVAQKHQVLHAAHGGIFDAHTHAERAAVMTAAIHSMTEAGLDEEVAKKVFELDKSAVARVLAVASQGTGGASPRGACLEELLALCAEFGIKTRHASMHASKAADSEGKGTSTGPQSQSSPATEALLPPAPPRLQAAPESGNVNVNVNSWMHAPVSPRTPTEAEHGVVPGAGNGDNGDGGLEGLPCDGLLITDEFLREAMEKTSLRAQNGPWVAEQTVLAQEEVKRSTTAGRPQALLGAGSRVKGRSSSSSPESTGPKQSAGPSAGTEDEGEGAIDLIFSQLEILRLLQVVMR